MSDENVSRPSRFTEPMPQTDWPHNPVDFHCHTDRSDGVLSPAELYKAMADCGLEVVAVSDHDTLAGYRELRDAGLAAQLPLGGPRMIPAVEINSIADRTLIEMGVELDEGELHILGYGVDADSADVRGGPRRAAQRPYGSAVADHRQAARAGVPIDEQIAPALASEEAVGRPHIARAMVAAGHVASVQEAFDLWIDRSGPAYVARQGMRTREAIDAITAAGGICVLAHYPAAPEQPTLTRLLLDWGVRGLEVYYRRFPPETVLKMEALTESLGMLATGGSDYHGDGMTYAEAMATTYVPRAAADRLAGGTRARRRRR